MSEENKEQSAVNSEQSAVCNEPEDKVPPIASALPEAMPLGQTKTAGVRQQRSDAGRRVLERAAKAAAKTGKRGDVHEYMRLRRGYI